MYRMYRYCLIACSAYVLATSAFAQPQGPQRPPGGAPPAQAQPAAPAPQAAPAAGAPPPSPLAAPVRTEPGEVEAVAARLAQTLNKEFVVDPRLRGINFGLGDTDAIDYASFISRLRVHGAVVIEGDDVVYVVPEAIARYYNTPIVQQDDADLHPATWVARVITTTYDAPQLLGILRPLVEQNAVMAIYPPNKLLVVERYDNVKRITEIVRQLEQR